MSRDPEFVTITAKLLVRTDAAAKLSTDDVDAWVPFYAMHFMSRSAIQRAAIGDEIEVRMTERMAEEKGFL